MEQHTDEKTIRELTEEYRGMKVKFQIYKGHSDKAYWTEYNFEGIISHAITLRSFMVIEKNRLREVYTHNLEFIK